MDGSGSPGVARPVPTVEGRLYVQQDANWNTTALTDASGAVQQRFTYDPYGKATARDASTCASTTDAYTFLELSQGARNDSVTGLVGSRQRDRNVNTGRWMQADPLQYVDGMNRYQQLSDSPVEYLDPSGMSIWDYELNNPWDLWAMNRSPGALYDLTNTDWGNVVKGLATTGLLQTQAINDTTRKVSSLLYGQVAPTGSSRCLETAGSTEPDANGISQGGVPVSTKPFEATIIWATIGQLHADWLAHSTAVRLDTGWKVKSDIRMRVWDNWHWKGSPWGNWQPFFWEIHFSITTSFFVPDPFQR
jgi:RHS repeat-associated protein